MPPRSGQDRSPRRRVKEELSSRQMLEPFVYALFAWLRVGKSTMERQIPPLSLRDAGEKYECAIMAELRPARKQFAIGLCAGASTTAGLPATFSHKSSLDARLAETVARLGAADLFP